MVYIPRHPQENVSQTSEQYIMVSIIVPIYNREKYLRRCIDSIVAQTYSDIEIILIDDGSMDASGQICDEYAQHDARIHVIHQENIGLSLSRILGIKQARSEYVMFVDSDDWIELNMVECMLKEAQTNGVDLVWCDFMLHFPKHKTFSNIPFKNNPSEMLKAIYEEKVHGCVWNKLYRTELWRNLEASKNDILEDMFYTTQILTKNPSMSFVSIPLYHYDQTPTDALSHIKDFWVKCLPNYEYCYQYLVTQQCSSIYKAALSVRALKSKIMMLNQGQLKDAQRYAVFANVNIRNYPVSFPISVIYWIGLNGGVIGRLLMNTYLRYSRKVAVNE